MSANIRFAFKNLSTTTLVCTWEIKNLSFNSDCNTELVSVDDLTTLEVLIWEKTGGLCIQKDFDADIVIYDAVGRMVYVEATSSNTITEVALPQVVYPGTVIDTVQIAVVKRCCNIVFSLNEINCCV